MELDEDDFNAEVVTSLLPIFQWPEVSSMVPPNIKGLRKQIAVRAGRAGGMYFCRSETLQSEEIKTNLEK